MITYKTIEHYYLINARKRNASNPTRGRVWARVLKSLNKMDVVWPEDQDVLPMTSDDARTRIQNWGGWKPVADLLAKVEQEREQEEYDEIDRHEQVNANESESPNESASESADVVPVPTEPDPEIEPETNQSLFPIHVDSRGWVTDPRNGVRVRVWREHSISNLRYRLITSRPDGVRQITWFADFYNVPGSMGCLCDLPGNKETEDRWITPEELPNLIETYSYHLRRCTTL